MVFRVSRGDMSEVSVIVSTWSMNEFRSAVMRESIRTLLETAPEAEIIVCDNGGNLADSIFLLNLCEEKKIACYIRNRNNMSFGYARNQGLDMTTGEYIVIADNDILYKQGWLEWFVVLFYNNDHKNKFCLYKISLCAMTMYSPVVISSP